MTCGYIKKKIKQKIGARLFKKNGEAKRERGIAASGDTYSERELITGKKRKETRRIYVCVETT